MYKINIIKWRAKPRDVLQPYLVTKKVKLSDFFPCMLIWSHHMTLIWHKKL